MDNENLKNLTEKDKEKRLRQVMVVELPILIEKGKNKGKYILKLRDIEFDEEGIPVPIGDIKEEIVPRSLLEKMVGLIKDDNEKEDINRSYV